MTSATPRATFRDPAGSLRFEDDLVIRSVGASSREVALDLLDSSFCRAMQQRGDLIDAVIGDTDAGLHLVHPKISIPTYPWEWTPSQWLAAAQLTLNLCEEALDAGWILKDATPLNVLFTGSCPIFVDILSFERRDPQSSIWLAYGQYVRTFLLPLLMNRLLSWPLSLSLFRRDGYEPADCFAALGWRQRLTRVALWSITLPTLLERRKQASATDTKKNTASQTPPILRDPEIASQIIKRILKKLRQRTIRAVPQSASSDWSEYQGTLTHYTREQSRKKLDWVRETLESTQPAHVLDIGANTGEFSALAASLGAEVVALERDEASADRLHRMARDKNLSIQTIHADLARPTPAVGWDNSESVALLPRLVGQFDLVMMLAVIHHLLLMEQIPLPEIISLCHRLTRHYLIVEWVPVEDPMFQSLLRGRDDLYGTLCEADLLDACIGRFRMRQRLPLDNGRILLLFEKIDIHRIDSDKINQC